MGFNKVIKRPFIISSKNHSVFADRDFYRSCMLSPIVSCRWGETVFNKVICYEERCCKPHEQMTTLIPHPLFFTFYTFLSWHPFLLKLSALLFISFNSFQLHFLFLLFQYCLLTQHSHLFPSDNSLLPVPVSNITLKNNFLLGIVPRKLLLSLEFWVCSSLKLGDGGVISLSVGFFLFFFCHRLNCVFVPINLIKSLIAFANHLASSCCCLLLPLISEITGPLLEHRASDNAAWRLNVGTSIVFWRKTLVPCFGEKVDFIPCVIKQCLSLLLMLTCQEHITIQCPVLPIFLC